TVHAIAHAHLTPKFVDIERTTCNISLDDVEKKITPRTSAILVVNTFGSPCQIEELAALANEYQLKLFFDSAAAIGAKYRGRYVGSFGHAEVFSLSGTKVVTAGEGGVITTNDNKLAQELESIRNYGYSKREKDCLYIGFNGKMSELNAIIALWSLDNMKHEIECRRKIAEIYYENLKKISGICFQRILDNCETNYCAFAIEIEPREFGLDASTLLECLREEGIETLRYFCPPMHKTRAYKEFNRIRLEQSEILSQRNLCLPMHSYLTAEQARIVCDAIERVHLHAGEIMQKRVAVESR
ncbi:MAG: DegT/DnrJ/EryC1/StrS family aminotransferase, partial [bacterium]